MSLKLPYFHVDAFAERPFTGNQAAVMPLERWLDLVAARFWSTFAHFDDAALAAGIADVRARATPDADGTIRFEERLVLIDAQV